MSCSNPIIRGWTFKETYKQNKDITNKCLSYEKQLAKAMECHKKVISYGKFRQNKS